MKDKSDTIKCIGAKFGQHFLLITLLPYCLRHFPSFILSIFLIKLLYLDRKCKILQLLRQVLEQSRFISFTCWKTGDWDFYMLCKCVCIFFSFLFFGGGGGWSILWLYFFFLSFLLSLLLFFYRYYNCYLYTHIFYCYDIKFNVEANLCFRFNS